MKPFLKFLIGLAAVIVLGVFSIEKSALPGSMASVEARLSADAMAALNAAGADWAEVDIDGQKAILYGEAPDEEAIERATNALIGAPWRTGPLIGAITAVDASAATIDAGPPLVEPFVWLAERQGEEIMFSGYVPSQAARDAIARLAAMRFADFSITDETEIALGAPPEEPWLAGVSISLQALARLQPGGVEASDADFTVTGVAPTPEEADTVRVLMDTTPAGVTGRAAISLSVPQAPTPRLTAIEPEAASDTEPLQDEPAAAASPDGAQETAEGIVEESDFEIVARRDDAPPTPRLAPRAPAPTADPEPDASASMETPQETPALAASAPALTPQEYADCMIRLQDMTAGFRLSFASNGIQMTAANDERLREIATLLLICQSFNLEIIGHTDATGREALNRQLSRSRASAAAAKLRAYGVARDRIMIRGAGSREPIADNATPEGRAQNRRIEFRPAPPAQE